jgi:hypothetical protein
MSRIRCFMLEPTGQMTPFVGGVSSPIYRRVDTGELVNVGWGNDVDGVPPRAPAGAVWRDSHGMLNVRTPGGDWHPEHPASGGERWTITGTAPDFTIRASILFDHAQSIARWGTPPLNQRSYHAFLTDGWLEEC